MSPVAGKAPPEDPSMAVWPGGHVWVEDLTPTPNMDPDPEMLARLALWTRYSAAAGKRLGERLRSLDWHSAALSVRRSR